MCSLIPLLSEDDRAEHGFHRRLISGVEVGAEAVRMLYWRLAHPDAPQRRLVLNTALVVGESARAIG